MDEIIRTVSNYFNIPIEHIKGKCRKREYVTARYICYKIIRGEKRRYKGYRYSLSKIGLAFNREHDRVLYGINKITDLIDTYPKLKEIYEDIANTKHLTIEEEIINNAVSCAQL